MIQDVFLKHGINLVVDPHHAVIPFGGIVVFDSTHRCDSYALTWGTSEKNFYDIKAQYFHPDRPNEHYLLLTSNDFVGVGGDGSCTFPGTLNGQAELPGANFIIDETDFIYNGFPRICDVSTGCVSTYSQYLEAARIMHELGHNLGLMHGGGDGVNWKPNYISVMNYLFSGGIPTAAATGSTVPNPTGTYLDYSESALPSLNESNLNEYIGIQSGTNVITDFANSECPSYFVSAPGTGPIDWNCDGKIQSGVQADINIEANYGFLSAVCRFPSCVMTGFDDWAEVHNCIATECSFGNVHNFETDPFPQGSYTPGQVTFHTYPSTFLGSSSPGGIVACGQVETDNSSTSCGRIFTAKVALPSASSDWVFDHWAWGGAVSCSSPATNPTTCTKNGNGTLTAYFDFKVSLLTVPTNIGSPEWALGFEAEYGSYPNEQYVYGNNVGGPVTLPSPTYAIISHNDFAGYQFSGYSCSGGVTCLGYYQCTMTSLCYDVYVKGPGNITGIWTPG